MQTTRDNQNFGKGDIRGVIAPESSNNAKEGGALIPTLLFGVPGSGATAVLLGGFVLLGLQPGPRMLTTNLDTTLAIVWTLAIANVIGAIACMAPSRLIARLSLIPAARLTPFILVVMLMGAYQSTRHWGDLIAFLAIGILGWVMRHLDWPRPPLLVGFVLATSAERYLWISAGRYEWTWLTRPGVILIALITVALTFAGARLRTTVKKGATS
jgi:TctA family transporter